MNRKLKTAGIILGLTVIIIGFYGSMMRLTELIAIKDPTGTESLLKAYHIIAILVLGIGGIPTWGFWIYSSTKTKEDTHKETISFLKNIEKSETEETQNE